MGELAPWSTEYRSAIAELLHAIANDLRLSDAALEVLVQAHDGPDNRKRLVLGLKVLELITPEQAAFAIAYSPKRGMI